MPARWKQIRRWRERVEQLRQNALDLAASPSGESMNRMAEIYERMAEHLERRLKERGIEDPDRVAEADGGEIDAPRPLQR